MKLNRRVCIKHFAGWTFGWNAAILAATARSSNACIQDIQGFEAEFPSMGSKINLRWYGKNITPNRIGEAASNIADYWCSVMSDYDPNSQAMLACVNADGGNWVPLSKELWSIVSLCDQWYRWSNGAFDAALGAITRLRRQRKLASQVQWDKARIQCGWDLLQLDPSNQTIRFLVPGVRLDFGAIGKGFIVDRIAEKLLEMEVERFVVNASGNMRIGKAPQAAEGWPISIDVPSTDSREAAVELLRMRVSQCGIATSGDRWQRFPDGVDASKNERSSHIIDPMTKMGVPGNQSVTIIAENAADADAAATATCVRARKNLAGWLQKLSEEKPNLQALVLLKDEASANIHMISTASEFRL